MSNQRDSAGRFLRGHADERAGRKPSPKGEYDSVRRVAMEHAGFLDTVAGRRRFDAALDRLYRDDPAVYARVIANLTPKGAFADSAAPQFDLAATVREIVKQGTVEADARRNEAVQLVVHARHLLAQPGTTLDDIRQLLSHADAP